MSRPRDVQRFFAWLLTTGEADRLARRAGARRRIVEAIADVGAVS